jgi:hypothetical protein
MALGLSALRAGRCFTLQKESWYKFLLEAEPTQGPSEAGGLGQLKNPVKLRIESATFRILA